jgi:ribosomal protein S27E
MRQTDNCRFSWEETDMGWNDHVDFVETECQDCGAVATWEFWNEVARARYGGANKRLGEMLGHDMDTTDGKCPSCGSTNGEPVGDDEDWDC